VHFIESSMPGVQAKNGHRCAFMLAAELAEGMDPSLRT